MVSQLNTGKCYSTCGLNNTGLHPARFPLTLEKRREAPFNRRLGLNLKCKYAAPYSYFCITQFNSKTSSFELLSTLGTK